MFQSTKQLVGNPLFMFFERTGRSLSLKHDILGLPKVEPEPLSNRSNGRHVVAGGRYHLSEKVMWLSHRRTH